MIGARIAPRGARRRRESGTTELLALLVFALVFARARDANGRGGPGMASRMRRVAVHLQVGRPATVAEHAATAAIVVPPPPEVAQLYHPLQLDDTTTTETRAAESAHHDHPKL